LAGGGGGHPSGAKRGRGVGEVGEVEEAGEESKIKIELKYG